jgi:hypothetical protein
MLMPKTYSKVLSGDIAKSKHFQHRTKRWQINPQLMQTDPKETAITPDHPLGRHVDFGMHDILILSSEIFGRLGRVG